MSGGYGPADDTRVRLRPLLTVLIGGVTVAAFVGASLGLSFSWLEQFS